MTKPIAATSILATVLFAAACGPQGGHVDLSNAHMAKGSSPIIGGTVDSGHPKVVLLYNRVQGYLCTGTVIGPSVVLTAGHCTWNEAGSTEGTASEFDVFGGTDVVNAGYDWKLGVTQIHTNPNYNPTGFGVGDSGIVILDDIAPTGSMAWASSDQGQISVGAPFTAVGFGITGAGTNTSGTKRTVALSVTALDANEFEFGSSTSNTCSGDSGGPAIMNLSGVDTVVGIVSYGDANCTQYGRDVRTDYAPTSTFIQQYADVTVTPTPGPTSTPTATPTATPPVNNAKDDSPFKSFGCDVVGLDASAGGALSMLLGAALALARRKRS